MYKIQWHQPPYTVPMRFSCKVCGLTDVLVFVPARCKHLTAEEWLNPHALRTLLQVHDYLRPRCETEELDSIKYPLLDGPASMGLPCDVVPMCGPVKGTPANLKLKGTW